LGGKKIAFKEVFPAQGDRGQWGTPQRERNEAALSPQGTSFSRGKQAQEEAVVLEAAIGSRRDFSIGVTDSKIFTLLFPEAFQKPSVNAFFA
jgi:hypothetical protein